MNNLSVALCLLGGPEACLIHRAHEAIVFLTEAVVFLLGLFKK